MQDGTISCHVDNLKRQRPDKSLRSAIETAAYNSRAKLWSAQNEAFADVSHRNDITYDALVAPEGAPDWTAYRSEVWNRIDAHAPRKDTRLAKTIMGSIARQIPHADRIKMLHDLVAPWVKLGVIADVAIHDDGSNHNPHVHVMLTTRTIVGETFGVKIKSVEQRRFVTDTRQRWTELNNAYLAKNGSSLRLDHRSFKARGIGAEPTRHRGAQQHLEREHAAAAEPQKMPEPERAPAVEQHLSQTVHLPQMNAAQPLEQDMPEPVRRDPTDAERRDYPLLTERENWPPSVEPTTDMNRAERSELRRYWDEHQIEKVEAERLLEAGTPEQQYGAEASAQDAYQAYEAEIDLGHHIAPSPEQRRGEITPSVKEHSSAQYARDIVFEAGYDRAIAERSAARRQEAIDLHRGLLGYTREERELLAAARDAHPEEARVIKDYIIFKRMEYLQARENQRLQQDMAKYLAPERLQAIKDRLEEQNYVALQAAQERVIAEREAEVDVQRAKSEPVSDHRTEMVQGPNGEPLHPRERDLAEEKMLDDMLREADHLPEQDLGEPIDHAHAARKMLRDFERNLDEEEQERDRER